MRNDWLAFYICAGIIYNSWSSFYIWNYNGNRKYRENKVIWIIISIAVLLIIFLYPLWSLGLYKLFATNKETIIYKGKKVYLCDSFPVQGLFLGFLHRAIVRRLYYTENGMLTNKVCYTVTKVQFDAGFRGTDDIKEHEIDGHDDQLKRYQIKYGKVFGFIFWLIWGLCNYAELPFWQYDSLPIEREPDSKETSVN